MNPTHDVTVLLRAWREGDATALDALIPLVHEELRRIAGRCLYDERANHSVQATELVNEAFLRLVDVQHRLEATGRPVVIADDVAWSASFATTHAALARDGTLAYMPGGEILPRRKISWVDRSGRRTAATDDARFYTAVRVSPDGTRLLLMDRAANDMLLVYDLARNRSVRLPLRGNVFGGMWTSDSRRVIAALDANLVSVAADGSGDVETIAKDLSPENPDVAPDNDTVAFGVGRRPDAGWDIWTLSLKTHLAKPCVATRFNERFPRYSRDGRWLAYESDETGIVEIFVRPPNCENADLDWRRTLGPVV